MNDAIKVALAAALLAGSAVADDLVFEATRADEAFDEFGLTGEGVLIAILDRGIDWDHPDFIRPDGTTRIRAILDMTGQNLCPGNPAPIEYSEADINAALQGGPALDTRDASGHGTATAGTAAGNGSAFASGMYRGLAPEADLIVVKVTSEGAPAHDGEPPEAAFQACYDEALDWLDAKIDELGMPCVAILNSGTMWGPMDGTSAVSRKIDEVFGADSPGRIMVIPSGDEGGLPTHAQAVFDDGDPAVVEFDKVSAATAFGCMWYSGDHPATITFSFDDGTVVGPVSPNQFVSESGVQCVNYLPGTEFYPWLSTSGDRAVWFNITGHAVGGEITIDGLGGPPATIDVYHAGDDIIQFTSGLVSGRLTDYATTHSAIVVGCSVVRTMYTDINGTPRTLDDEGDVDELWAFSAEGPTRDGRAHGVDVTAPGHNNFASLAQESYWSTLEFNQVQDGGGWYTRFGATSAAAPITVGAIALLLERNPLLTADDVRAILRDSATSDSFTGTTPNRFWGFGRLDVFGAIGMTPLGCDGDANGDGAASVDDLLIMLANFGPCSGPCAGDVNLDGVIDVGDLLLTLANWGPCR